MTEMVSKKKASFWAIPTMTYTWCDDFQFTEVHVVRSRNLNDEVSERWSVVLAIQRDCLSGRYSAWILATQSVVPQGR